MEIRKIQVYKTKLSLQQLNSRYILILHLKQERYLTAYNLPDQIAFLTSSGTTESSTLKSSLAPMYSAFSAYVCAVQVTYNMSYGILIDIISGEVTTGKITRNLSYLRFKEVCKLYMSLEHDVERWENKANDRLQREPRRGLAVETRDERLMLRNSTQDVERAIQKNCRGIFRKGWRCRRVCYSDMGLYKKIGVSVDIKTP